MMFMRRYFVLYCISFLLIGGGLLSYTNRLLFYESKSDVISKESHTVESMNLCMLEESDFKEAKSIFDDGETHYKAEYYSDALAYFVRALILFVHLTTEDWQTFCLCRIAKCYQMMGELNRSAVYYTQALALAKKINHLPLYYMTLLHSVRTLFLLGKWEEAQIALVEINNQSLSTFHTTYERCQYLLENAHLNLVKGDYSETRKVLTYFFDMNKKNSFYVLEAEALRLRSQLTMIETADYQVAKQGLMKSLELLKTSYHKSEQASVFILLGELLSKQKNRHEALSYFDKAYTFYHQLNDKMALSYILLHKNVLMKVPDLYTHNVQLIEILEKGMHRPYYSEALIFLAHNAIESYELDQARWYLTKALTSAPELKNKHHECIIYTLLGEVDKKNRNFESAQKNLTKAIHLSDEKKDLKAHVNALITLSSIESDANNNQKSLENLRYVLKLAKKYKYTYEIAKCHFYLGIIYMYNGSITNAEHAFKKAAHIFSDQNYHFEHGKTIFYQAQLEIYRGNFSQADALSQRCLEIFESIHNNEYRAKTTSLIAYASFVRGNHQFARDFYQKAAQLAQKSGNTLLATHIHIQQALIDARESNIKDAVLIIKNNEPLVKQLGDTHLSIEFAYLKALVDFNKGFFSSALQIIHEGICLCDQNEHAFLRLHLTALKAYILVLRGKDEDVFPLIHQIREQAQKLQCLPVIAVSHQMFAFLNIKQTKFEEARIYANHALKIAEEINNPQHIGMSYNCLSMIENSSGNRERAKEYAEKALTYHRNINYLIGVVKTSILLSQIYLKDNDTENALNTLKNVLPYVQAIDNKDVHGEALVQLAKVYVCDEKYEEARRTYKKAFVIFKKSNDMFLCTQILSELSHVELSLGHFEQSLIYLNEAQTFCHTIQDENILFDIFKQFGNLYRVQKNYSKAGAYYARALAITKKLNFLHEEGEILYEMLIMDMNQFQWDAAKSKGESAIRLFNQVKDVYFSGVIWTKLGVIERLQNHYEQARICLNTAQKVLMNTAYKAEKARVLHEMGTLEILRHNEKKGKHYYKDSLALYQSSGSKIGLGKLYISMALFEFYKHNIDESIQKLKEALVVFQTTKNPIWQGMTLLGLSRLYQKKKQQAEAEFYLQESRRIEKKFKIINKDIISFYGFSDKD